MSSLFDYFEFTSPLPVSHPLFLNFLDRHYETVGELWSARAHVARLEVALKEVTDQCQELINEKTIVPNPAPIRLRRTAKSDASHAGTRHSH